MATTVKLAAIVAGSSIAAGGVGYAGYRYVASKADKSFSSFSEAFLKVDGDESLWTAKLKALETGKVLSGLVDLVNAKSKNELASLKKACQKFYDPNFSSQGEKDFSDFKNYCAKNNKDVVGEAWISDFKSVENAEKLINKIKARGNKVISKLLSDLVTNHEGKAKTDEAKNALNAWCKQAGEGIYLGKEDLDLKTGREYCKEITG